MLAGVVLLCLVAGERGGHAADLPLAPHQGGKLVQLHNFYFSFKFKSVAKIEIFIKIIFRKVSLL